mgnify:CR=1 FL=1
MLPKSWAAQAMLSFLLAVQGDTTSEDRVKGWTEGIEAGGCTVLDMQYTDAVADKAVTTLEA